jgi:urea transport system permease protein
MELMRLRPQAPITRRKSSQRLVSAESMSIDAGRAGFYRDGSAYFDFLTAEERSGRPDNFKTVRVNNRVRGGIQAALGTLRLRARDPAARIATAQTVLGTADKAALPVLDKLLTTEADPDVKRVFEQARAAIILNEGASPDEALLAAVATLRKRGDQEAIAALRAGLQSQNEAVREASASAVAAIERDLAALQQVQNVWYGLSLGSVLAEGSIDAVSVDERVVEVYLGR